MKYFKTKLSDAGKATTEVWHRQHIAGLKGLMFHISGSLEVSVWTEDSIGEMMLRNVLNEMCVEYEESNEQQVTTFLDRYSL
jgi:hypothetical protein